MSVSGNILSRLRRGPVLVMGAAVLVAALLIASRPERPALELPEKSWSVTVMPATPASVRPNLELYARVESRQDASLSAALEADVMEVLVQDGDRVAAGQSLIVLDDQDAQLELVQREADVQEIRADIKLERQRRARNLEALVNENELLALTESNAERVRSLYKDKLLSQANVDDSAEEYKRQQLSVTSRQLSIEESEIRINKLQAQLRRAQALRDRARLAADRTLISAPFAGAISNLNVSVGDRVRVGDELMRLHNPASLELHTQVPSRYSPRIRDALLAKLELPTQVMVSGEEYAARLARISSQTREGSGSVEAYLDFIDLPPETQLGATLRVLLSLPAEPNALAIPAEAIYGRNRIYIVADSRLVGLDVERLGERQLSGGRTEVIVRSSQLKPDDQIITTKLSAAADGLLVEIAGQSSAQAMDAMLAAGSVEAGDEGS